MKMSIPRDEAGRLAVYHAQESHGMDPVIEDDQDLAEWVLFTLSSAVGCDPQEIEVAVKPTVVIINSTPDIIADVRLGWM